MALRARVTLWAIGILFLCGIGAFVAFRPDRILMIGAGLAAHEACSTAFVSKLPVEPAVPEQLRALMGFPANLIHFSTSLKTQTASASFLGLAPRTARFTPGFGCRLEYSANEPFAALSNGKSEPARSLSNNPTHDSALDAAIEQVFAEGPHTPIKNVKAVLVIKDSRVIAERYAPGVGPDTRLPSWSIAKSLTNAVVGVLVRQGRLQVDELVNAPEWMKHGDPRAAITIEQLMRMTSGLDAAENGAPSDPVAQMEFAQPDMATFAAKRPLKAQPGTQWEYTSANTLVLSRLLGARIGGGAAGMHEFVRREIAAPLGISSLILEYDAVGTFVGSSFAYATARDYGRLGQLYLDDGIGPDHRRILPKGWVEWSRRSTLGSSYGAGFWTNDGGSDPARRRIAAGFPADGFYASGVLGQRIYIIPQSSLVIVRLGNSMPPDFGIDDDLNLIAAARAVQRIRETR